MIQATELRKGTTIVYKGEIHVVVDFRHYTPGNKRGFVQAQLRSLKTGVIAQYKFASEDRLERAVLEKRRVQYLYSDAAGFHFMDLADYNQVALSKDLVGDGQWYLKEEMELELEFHDGKPVRLALPKQVALRVMDSPPGVRGDSVSNAMKPATLETGLKIQVPLFVEEGTVVRVDTDEGKYVGRE